MPVKCVRTHLTKGTAFKAPGLISSFCPSRYCTQSDEVKGAVWHFVIRQILRNSSVSRKAESFAVHWQQDSTTHNATLCCTWTVCLWGSLRSWIKYQFRITRRSVCFQPCCSVAVKALRQVDPRSTTSVTLHGYCTDRKTKRKSTNTAWCSA